MKPLSNITKMATPSQKFACLDSHGVRPSCNARRREVITSLYDGPLLLLSGETGSAKAWALADMLLLHYQFGDDRQVALGSVTIELKWSQR